MTPAVPPGLVQALAALNRALQRLAAPSMILGGIAVIARGVPRLTTDVDATVWGEGLAIHDLYSVLKTEDIVRRPTRGEELARQRQVLLLVHEPTGTPLEILLAWLPFEREAIDRASLVTFGGSEILAAQAEDLIVYKFVAWRDRDKDDIQRLLVLHVQHIDLPRVRHLALELAAALEDPARVEELEAMIARALDDEG